ncbi:MAG: hypothetical protein FJ386_01585 [Verrucomicrobia bacterium]|nr:hypothetical protein [Verrucomicrobiota bacterium]
MTVPLFIRIQGMLVNLAATEVAYCAEETPCVATSSESFEFEYADTARASQALKAVHDALAAKLLIVGDIE